MVLDVLCVLVGKSRGDPCVGGGPRPASRAIRAAGPRGLVCGGGSGRPPGGGGPPSDGPRARVPCVRPPRASVSPGRAGTPRPRHQEAPNEGLHAPPAAPGPAGDSRGRRPGFGARRGSPGRTSTPCPGIDVPSGHTAGWWEADPLLGRGREGEKVWAPGYARTWRLGRRAPNLSGGFAGQTGGGGGPRPPPRPSPRVPGTKAECLPWGRADNGPRILPLAPRPAPSPPPDGVPAFRRGRRGNPGRVAKAKPSS